MIFFNNLSDEKTQVAFAQLIFAIAAIDGKFNHNELIFFNQKIISLNLTKEIQENLLIKISDLRVQNQDAEKLFDSFLEFKKQNENLFDKESKQIIWEICEQIASVNSGKNKSELVMLSRLASTLSS